MADKKKNNFEIKNKLEKIQKELAVFTNQFFTPIIFILMTMILLGGYFLVIRVQYGNLVKSRDVDLVELEESINEINQQLAFFSQYAKEEVGFTDEEKDLLSRILPDNFDFPSVVVQFTSLAETYDAKVLSVDVDEGLNSEVVFGADKFLRKVDINAEVYVENYDKWRRFISSLESSAMVFDVKSINFSGSSNYSLKLSTYYYDTFDSDKKE